MQSYKNVQMLSFAGVTLMIVYYMY